MNFFRATVSNDGNNGGVRGGRTTNNQKLINAHYFFVILSVYDIFPAPLSIIRMKIDVSD
jgi:hypothetical protein